MGANEHCYMPALTSEEKPELDLKDEIIHPTPMPEYETGLGARITVQQLASRESTELLQGLGCRLHVRLL